MNNNASSNMGSILGSRISKSLQSAATNTRTTQDLSVANIRAGWRQRFGAMQMEAMVPNAYALFGGWSGNSNVVGP